MKYLKITRHELSAAILILAAFLLRILLARATWPLPNSDEATIGVMAIHIQQGARPIFFYGQNYMGSLEAYIAAVLFYPFGVSVFALKLSVILLFTLFLIGLYLLVRTLYTKNLALFTLLLFTMGSNAVLSRQLTAIGGYTETLLFGVFLFCIAAWLVLSPQIFPQKNYWRLLGFAAWGLVLGLALWSDLLILPVALCAGLILVLFCWRELLKGAIIPLLVCFIIGALPLILYNINAAPGQDSWSVLMSQQGKPLSGASTLHDQVKATMDISIPTITGSPFCHTSEYVGLSLLGFEQPVDFTYACHLTGRSWSALYLFLLGLSLVISIVVLVKAFSAVRVDKGLLEEQQKIRRSSIQLLLLCSALLTLILYTHSSSPLVWPAILSRYLICLWIAAPAILWPLWLGATYITQKYTTGFSALLLQLRKSLSQGILFAIVVIFIFGTWRTLGEIPQAQVQKQQTHRLIAGLIHIKATHLYSDYWNCTNLIFQSKEQIICGDVEGSTGLGVDRYPPYYNTVNHDPNSAYIITGDTSWDAAEAVLKQQGKKYRIIVIEGYTVYQPIP